MDFLDILRSDGSIVVNKSLARVLGLDASILFSEIVSKFKYHQDREELTEGNWFYFTEDKIEQNTTLKRSVQDKAIKKLVDLGLIMKKLMGMPSKRYFTICKEAIVQFLTLHLGKPEKNQKTIPNQGCSKTTIKVVEKEPPSLSENDNQGCSKATTNNTYDNTKNNTGEDNTDLSISNDKVAMICVSEAVKMIVRAYQDRLTDYDLKSIEKLFKMNVIPNVQFEEVLATVLDSSFDDLFKYLRKSLYTAKNQVKVQEKVIPFPTQEEKLNYSHLKTKNVRGLPEWIEKQMKNEKNGLNDDEHVSWDKFLQVQSLLVQLGEISEEQAQQTIEIEKLKRNRVEHILGITSRK
jgi:hypothetical protein